MILASPAGGQATLSGFEIAAWLVGVGVVTVVLALVINWRVRRRGRVNAAIFLWAVLAAAAVATIGLFVAPRLSVLVPPGGGPQVIASRQGSIRDAALKVAAAIGAAIAGWVGIKRFELSQRAHELSERQQLTERFSRSVQLLGHLERDARLGGIYALEQIYRDSPEDRATIVEVLAAYARGHLPPQAPLPEVPPDRRPAPLPIDIQASLTVLSRLVQIADPPRRIDLRGINTSVDSRYRASLPGGDLTGADLGDANLIGAQLGRAKLIGAQLGRANLIGANLIDANLTDAYLTGADLSTADLSGANLQRSHALGVKFIRANLASAKLGRAFLASANFSDAFLGGVDFTNANLTEANLTQADITLTVWAGAITDRAIFEGVIDHGAPPPLNPPGP